MSAIHLPNTLTRIDNKAFEDCSSLKEVILPDAWLYLDLKFYADAAIERI